MQPLYSWLSDNLSAVSEHDLTAPYKAAQLTTGDQRPQYIQSSHLAAAQVAVTIVCPETL